MPDFDRVDHPVFPPTQCLTCRSQANVLGFIDTGIEVFPYGRIYLCGSCAVQAGTRFGMLEAKVAAELRGALDDERAEVARLVAQLADARDTRLVSMGDLEALFAREPSLRQSGLAAQMKAEVCPDCGGAKNADSKRCRACHTASLNKPKAEATA